MHADIDAEVDQRIQKAATAFGKLRKRVFEDTDIRTATKIKVYRAIVLTSLLYASETWTTYKKHLKKLEKFNQICLRKLLNIKWQDYMYIKSYSFGACRNDKHRSCHSQEPIKMVRTPGSNE